MLNYISTGNIIPRWDDSYKKFNGYVRQPIKPSEVYEWREQGYNHNTFSGIMYSSKNTIPSWAHDVASELKLNKPGFVFYCMRTMEVMPPHVDHFETYCKVFNVSRENVYRGLVMLEDWKPGHYLEMDRKGYVNWSAGDYFIWSSDVEHAASNIGIEDRWTLQITGLLNG